MIIDEVKRSILRLIRLSFLVFQPEKLWAQTPFGSKVIGIDEIGHSRIRVIAVEAVLQQLCSKRWQKFTYMGNPIGNYIIFNHMLITHTLTLQIFRLLRSNILIFNPLNTLEFCINLTVVYTAISAYQLINHKRIKQIVVYQNTSSNRDRIWNHETLTNRENLWLSGTSVLNSTRRGVAARWSLKP